MRDSHSRSVGKHPASAFDVANVHFSAIYDPTLHLIMQADGAFDAAALEIAVAAAGTMAPILAAHYSEEEDRGYWQSGMGDKPGFSVHETTGTMDSNHLPLVSIDPFTGPQMDVRLCRSAGEEGDVLIISCHHGAMDANGLFQAAALYADAYRRVCEGKPPLFQGPSWEQRGTDVISAQFSDEERDAVYERESVSADNWTFPYRDGSYGPVVWDSFTIDADQVTRLRAVGKETGMTLNDRILAAYFCALVQVCGDAYREAPFLGILSAMDLRRYLPEPPYRSLCNLSVAYELSISRACCGKMSVALPAVSGAMQVLKEGNFGLGAMVLYERLYAGGAGAVKAFLTGIAEEFRRTGKKNPFLSNVGAIPSPAAAFQHGEDGTPLQVTGAFLTTREAHPPGICAYVSTYRGEMTVTFPFPSGAYDPQEIRALAEAMQAFILEFPLNQ